MSAGLNRNDVGTDRAHTQGRGDPCLDISGVHRAVQQQDFDQFTGPLGVAVDPAGCCPERLMGAGERPGFPRPGQGSGSRECAGFGSEDFQVVVQLDRLPALGSDPLMPGDHGASVEHHDLGCPQGHPDLPSDEPCRDGVLHHPHGDHRGPVHPGGQHQTGVECLQPATAPGTVARRSKSWPMVRILSLILPLIVLGFPDSDAVVELIKGLHDRHRGEPVPAEPADLALNPALLVGPAMPGWQ